MGVSGYFIPSVNLQGVGSVKEVGNLSKNLGSKKVLIVTDAFLEKIGKAEQVKVILEEAGLKAVIFGGAEPNPTDKNVEAG